MTEIPKAFVDQVRAQVDLIDYASRFHDLKRKGTEYSDVKNPSLTFSKTKQTWGEFGTSHMPGKATGGDVIAYEMARTGCTFPEAIEALAAIAHIRMPRDYEQQRSRNGNGNGHHRAPPSDGPPPASGPEDYGFARPLNDAGFVPRDKDSGITRKYDYRDRHGNFIYQVCRTEFTKDGKREKYFFQRRPVPGEDGNWIVGRDKGVYLRGKNGDFVKATEGRLSDWKWRGAEQIDVELCSHLLYRLPELCDELDEPADERRPILICEGEKDVETLVAWGFVATCNSGGAKNWQPEFGEWFADCEVIVLTDNDAAGASWGEQVAASIKPYAANVSLLSWANRWKDAPAGADVTDWRERNGGSPELLLEIIDQLEPWAPALPKSNYGAVHFSQLDEKGPELEWLVKNIITRGDVSIWYGNWSAGKSFLAVDLGMAIARGSNWFGRRTAVDAGELVVYQAGEGWLGVKNRLRAYRNYYRIMDALPFVLLSQRINFFVSDKDHRGLVEEIKALHPVYGRCALLVLDTFAAMSPGADENNGRDVGPVLERCRQIANEVGCHVMIIDHVNKAGEAMRGWSGKQGNVDTSVLVENTMEPIDQAGELDGKMISRELRRWRVIKQKDQPRSQEGSFTLHQVELEKDKDGEPVTSAVVGQVLGREEARAHEGAVTRGWAVLQKDEHVTLFRCLDQTIRKHGRRPPPEVKDVPPDAMCITKAEWNAAYRELSKGHFDLDPAQVAKLNARVYRAQNDWARKELIGTSDIWVWRTNRKVHKIDKAERRAEPAPEQEPILAPGETPTTLEDSISIGGY